MSTLKAALSVWGNPEKIMISFNSTTVGFERTVSYYTDLPIGIDEKQQAKGKQDMIDQWVYMLAGEIGKKRGTAKGLQQTMEWSAIGLTTAEEPLHGTQSHSGVLTRILDIYGKPFDKPEYAKQVHQNIGKCYGNAGKIYINKIIEEWYNKQDELRGLYKSIVAKLSINNDDKIAANIESVAVAILGDYLSSKYVFNVDNLNESIEFGRRIIEHLSTKQESDIIERAYEDISSWCIANTNYFKQNQFGENYGELIGDKYHIFNIKFNEIVNMLGYSPKQIRMGFKEKGYFYCTQESSKDGSSVRTVNSIKAKVFILKVDKNTNRDIDMELDAIDIQRAQAEEYKARTR